MGLREAVNRNRALAAGIACVAAVAAIMISVWRVSGPPPIPLQEDSYLSTDDGQTWFAARERELPPVPIDGKMAYGVLLYEDGGKPFVGYLLRYTPTAKQAVQAAEQAKAEGKLTAVLQGHAQTARIAGMEIKRPGADVWQRFQPTSAPDGDIPALIGPSGKAAKYAGRSL